MIAMRLGFRTACLLSIVALAVPLAHAAMAPHYERMRELHMLIDDAGLQAKLAGRPIDKIEALPGGLFRVSARRCTVDVREVSPPTNEPPIPGPRNFRLEAGPPRGRASRRK